MTFNSVAYAAFLPAVVTLHWLLPHRARLHLLVAASYLFYGAWDWRFLGLVWLSTAVDFLVGRGLARTDDQARRRRLLAVSLLVNLGSLGLFKYAGFFVESATGLLERVGLSGDPVVLSILLPVGISFYTFQTLGYTIDVYRGRSPACEDPVLFAAYVAYFPQLVAGPIERAERLLPQLARSRRRPRADQLESGVLLILLGLAKKVVIADQLAPIVDDLWATPADLHLGGVLLASLGFAFQLYADFSAYTDIARGSSRLLGVELIENFDAPFLAPDLTDLWRRWHISLTSWLRDYVYIPLGGNRGTTWSVRRNVMLTWLATGLWHGAAWTFVLWGVANGLLLLAHRWLRERGAGDRPPATRTRAAAGAAATTTLFALTFVLFRAPTLGDAVDLLVGLGRSGMGPVPPFALAGVASLVSLTIAIDLLRRAQRRRPRRALAIPEVRGVLAGAACVAIVLASGGAPEAFIYFQF